MPRLAAPPLATWRSSMSQRCWERNQDPFQHNALYTGTANCFEQGTCSQQTTMRKADRSCSICCQLHNMDWDRVVGRATRYRLVGPGIERWWVARFSAPVQTGPGAHPANRYRVFPGGKAAGAWLSPPTPSRTGVKDRVELYFCAPSGPSWPVAGSTLPFYLYLFALWYPLMQGQLCLMYNYTCSRCDGYLTLNLLSTNSGTWWVRVWGEGGTGSLTWLWFLIYCGFDIYGRRTQLYTDSPLCVDICCIYWISNTIKCKQIDGRLLHKTRKLRLIVTSSAGGKSKAVS